MPRKVTINQDMLPRLKHYELYRDYIKHEDSLINNRLLWNLNLQGFLFGAYSFSLQKVGELHAKALGDKTADLMASHFSVLLLNVLLIVLPLVGGSVSLLVWMGVQAAQLSIEELNKQWEDKIDPQYHNQTPQPLPYLPELTGGGVMLAHKLGFRAPLLIPTFMLAAWAILLISFVALFYKR